MAVNGISGTNITGTLSNGSATISQTYKNAEYNNFKSLLENIESKKEKNGGFTGTSNLSSSQVSSGKKLNGDYTQGFEGTFTSEKDKHASPSGMAAQAYYGNAKKPEIDKTSELYESAMEMENYLVKMMLSSMRSTIMKSDLTGSENSYARDMYEDMLYDNYAEQLTKSSSFGLADQIYIELSGQR